MDKNITLKETASGGSFRFEQDGEQVGEMHYQMRGSNTMVIDHTEVDEKMEGQGIGKKLLADLVEFVREKNIKVVPQCSFANATFRRMKDWQDVLETNNS